MSVRTKSRPGTSLPERERKHLQRCYDDLAFYTKTHVRIRTKDGQLVPLTFKRAQKLVHDRVAQQNATKGQVRAIVLKARQEGVSTYVAGRFFRRAHLFDNQRVMVIAHEKKASAAIFEMYDRMYKNLLEEIRPPTYSTQRGQVLHMVNDSQVVVDTAMDPDAGRSTTLQCLHASEFAFWPYADETYASLQPTIGEQGTEIIIESTANGVGNVFHQMWDDAEAMGFVRIFLPWWIDPDYELRITEEERLEILESQDPYERQALDEGFEWEGAMCKLTPEKLAWRKRIGIPQKARGNLRKFQQEYPTTAREAFVVTGDTFFEKDALEAYERNAVKPLRRGRIQLARNGVVEVKADGQGYVRIWEWPKPEQVYVIGADAATGKLVGTGDPFDEKGGRDFSCAQVYRTSIFVDNDGKPHKPAQVAKLHGRMPPEVFAQLLQLLGYLYNTALLGPERNHKCVDHETEALTPQGWKTYDRLHEGDLIRTLDPRTKRAEWQPIRSLYKADVEDEPMALVEKKKHRSLTTMNHRWFVQRANTSVFGPDRLDTFTTSAELKSHDRILCAAPSADSPNVKQYRDEFVELVGWFWTEGTINNHGGGSIRLSQSDSHNPAYVRRIRVLLERLYGPAQEKLRPGGNSKPEAQWRESVEGRGMRRWYLNAAAGKPFLEVAPDRVPTPEFLSALTEEQLWVFLQASMSAEASWAKPSKQWAVWVVQKRKEPLDSLQMAASLWGIGSSLAKMSNGQWCLTFHKQQNVLPAYTGHGNGVKQAFYSGTVWCPTVDNGVWLARRQGRVFYTGNSGETVVQKIYRDSNYPNTYTTRQTNTTRDGRPTTRWGWWTTNVTRPIMLDELSEAIRNESIGVPDADTVREMFTFITDDKGVPGAQPGAHDDRVMALAIALQLAQTAKALPKGRLPDAEVYSSPSGAFDYGWD